MSSTSSTHKRAKHTHAHAHPEKSISGFRSQTRSISEFEILDRLGQGTYGIVYKGTDKRDGSVVALKELRLGRDSFGRSGFPAPYCREILVLEDIQHNHIVKMREVIVGKSIDSIFLVFDYYKHDLSCVLHQPKFRNLFDYAACKTIVLQLILAVSHLHSQNIVHRDIKMSNLLYSNGESKLCDFGLARYMPPSPSPFLDEYEKENERKRHQKAPSGPDKYNLTTDVVTLHYRCPELLLGAKIYGFGVDVWSVGCVFGELFLDQNQFKTKSASASPSPSVLFPGYDPKSQFMAILKVMGMPGYPWEGLKLPNSSWLSSSSSSSSSSSLHRLKSKCSSLTDSGIDLLQKLLSVDPARRISMKEAMNHQFFKEDPLPLRSAHMPSLPYDVRLDVKAHGRVDLR